MAYSTSGAGERIQKIMAEAGICSRREAEKMIKSGEVTVNGAIAKLGDKALLGRDHIKVNGKLIHSATRKVVIAFFKPRDVFVSTQIPQNQDKGGTVWGYLSRVKEKVFPVGRLDNDTEGLLLLTNDGDLSERLTKPEFKVARTYTVKVDGHLEDKKWKRLQKGFIVDGEKIRPLEVFPLRQLEGKEWIRIKFIGPKNRLVRRAFENLGHPVDKVRCETVGPVNLKGLTRGTWRYLAPQEIAFLRDSVGLAPGQRE